MTSLLQELGLSFIPLFVAVDAIGILPFALALLRGMDSPRQQRAINYALLTALGLGLGFIAIGQFAFRVLGISSHDFLIAGGLLLLALSLRDITTGKLVETPPGEADTAGFVPIGTPLIVGPAVLTTLLLLIGQYSYPAVLLAFALNLALTWVVLLQGNRISRFLGRGGQRAATKIASLLLAAIAVKMIRSGILGFFSPG